MQRHIQRLGLDTTMGLAVCALFLPVYGSSLTASSSDALGLALTRREGGGVAKATCSDFVLTIGTSSVLQLPCVLP